MSTEELRSLLLWLHIAGAIVGFGPTFTFPVWAALARRAGPDHVPFALRGIGVVARRIVVPMAVVLPFTGFQRRAARQRAVGPYSMANLLVILGLMVWTPGS